nr:MAG TPA: hypothetical protein [Caudoviricetes sp.]
MVVFIRAVLRRSTGIIILALFRGSCSNDMEDFYQKMNRAAMRRMLMTDNCSVAFGCLRAIEIHFVCCKRC